MTKHDVNNIRRVVSRLLDPADLAELVKSAQSQSIASALADDGPMMDRSLAIAEVAEARLEEIAAVLPFGAPEFAPEFAATA